MSLKRRRQEAMRRARLRARLRRAAVVTAVAVVTGASAAAGYSQMPNEAQLFFLFGASGLSALLEWLDSQPPGGGLGDAVKKGWAYNAPACPKTV